MEIATLPAKIADKGKAMNGSGTFIQKDAFEVSGNSLSVDPNTFLLKKSLNPPGKIYSSN